VGGPPPLSSVCGSSFGFLSSFIIMLLFSDEW
jgi:hypothetical protein